MTTSPSDPATGVAMLSGFTLYLLESNITITIIDPRTTDTILAVTMLAEESNSTWSSGHSPVLMKFIPSAKKDATKPQTIACNWKQEKGYQILMRYYDRSQRSYNVLLLHNLNTSISHIYSLQHKTMNMKILSKLSCPWAF